MRGTKLQPGYLDNVRFPGLKKKVVTLVILINIVIILVYFSSTGTRSTAIFVSTFSPLRPNSNSNHGDQQQQRQEGTPGPKDPRRVLDVSTFSLRMNASRHGDHNQTSTQRKYLDHTQQDLGHETTIQNSTNISNSTHKTTSRPVTVNSAESRSFSKSPPGSNKTAVVAIEDGTDQEGPPTTFSSPTTIEIVYDDGVVVTRHKLPDETKNDRDDADQYGEENPLIHRHAFPNHVIPESLLDWRPAPHSSKYFQPIDTDKGWVFSAYYDSPAVTTTDWNRSVNGTAGIEEGGGDDMPAPVAGGSTVRVFVTIKRQMKTWMYCQFYDHNGVVKAVKKGRKKTMKDKEQTTYGPFSYECPIPSRKMATRPYYLSLTTDPDNSKPTNHVKIQYPGPPIRNFTVCFSPLHSNYNFTGQLVEAIEFNRVLGADHFVVYNFSISPETDTILRLYQSEGLVTIIQWPLPNLEMWYYGQILAINDCIYRNKGISKFVVITDTDEIVVPHLHKNWISLISDLNTTSSFLEDTLSEKVRNSIPRHTSKIHQHSPIGAWSFRCAFFVDKRLEIDELKEMKKREFSLGQKKFLVQFPSRRMLSLKRMGKAFDHGIKSKMIVRPEFVDTGSIHIVANMKTGYQVAFVKPETAMLHHYRDFLNSRQSNTLDMSALRFKDSYLERLKSALVKFPNIFPAVARIHLDSVT